MGDTHLALVDKDWALGGTWS